MELPGETRNAVASPAARARRTGRSIAVFTFRTEPLYGGRPASCRPSSFFCVWAHLGSRKSKSRTWHVVPCKGSLAIRCAEPSAAAVGICEAHPRNPSGFRLLEWISQRAVRRERPPNRASIPPSPRDLDLVVGIGAGTTSLRSIPNAGRPTEWPSRQK